MVVGCCGQGRDKPCIARIGRHRAGSPRPPARSRSFTSMLHRCATRRCWSAAAEEILAERPAGWGERCPDVTVCGLVVRWLLAA